MHSTKTDAFVILRVLLCFSSEMCGGAIISDFIPAAAIAGSRRLTADYLWPDLKKRKSDLDVDFEADFRDFKDDSDIDDDDDDHQVKPFAFAASSRRNFSLSFLSYAKLSLFTLFLILEH